MSDLNDDNIQSQIDEAVTKAQTLDDWKQNMTAQLAAKGIDITGATVHIAHTLDGAPRIDDVGEVRGGTQSNDQP
jgi:hypothetical protein